MVARQVLQINHAILVAGVIKRIQREFWIFRDFQGRMLASDRSHDATPGLLVHRINHSYLGS